MQAPVPKHARSKVLITRLLNRIHDPTMPTNDPQKEKKGKALQSRQCLDFPSVSSTEHLFTIYEDRDRGISQYRRRGRHRTLGSEHDMRLLGETKVCPEAYNAYVPQKVSVMRS